jgi:hypothetical protein
MTYKEYDNAWLEESGMPCSTTCYLRNGYLTDVETHEFTRTITPIAGTSTLIFEHENTDYIAMYSIVAVSNYIYFYYYNVDGYMYIVEYDKNTDATIELQIAHGSAYLSIGGSSGGGVAWIEGRKILCVSDNDDDWTGVYIVDFATSTVDRVVEMYSPTTTRSIVIDNHIWLYAFGYGATGWEIYYLDYTLGGDWTQVLIPFTGNEALNYHYPFFVDNNYLVWFVSRNSTTPPNYPEVQAWAFDLTTYSVQYSDWIGPGQWSNRAITIRSASSSADGKAYATASGQWNPFIPPFNYFDCWFEYIPSTNVLSLLYTLSMVQTSHPWSVVFSTMATTYIWNWYTEMFEDVTNLGVGLGSLPRGSNYWYLYNQYSHLMDDNSDSALICDGGYLKIVSALGLSGQNISISDIFHVHHIKYGLVVHTMSGDTERLYLVI